jgi:hypothetical protein
VTIATARGARPIGSTDGRLVVGSARFLIDDLASFVGRFNSVGVRSRSGLAYRLRLRRGGEPIGFAIGYRRGVNDAISGALREPDHRGSAIVMVGIGLYIRLGIFETPIFTRIVEERRVERTPMLEMLRRQPKLVALTSLALQRRVRLSPAFGFEGREPRLSARVCTAGLG